MKTELLMIGTELLLGQIQDTNSTWISQVLAEHGIDCYQKTTVGDNRARIMGALDAGLQRSDVILCSGGLGPTEDDITRESIGELLGRPLVFRPEVYEDVIARFAVLRRAPTDNNKKQATLPEGSVAIANPNGTAPGVIVEDERGIIICMPGVPHELKSMLVDSVIPYLKAKFQIQGVVHSRVLKVCGLGESRVDDVIGDLMNEYSNPTIGLLASPEFVRIRLTAKAESEAAAEALIEPVARRVYERLPDQIMGEGEDTLESKVASLLHARGYTLAVTESGTGGLISQRLAQSGHGILAEGRIRGTSKGDSHGVGGVDMGRKHMLDCGSTCAMVCLYQQAEESAEALFITPENIVTWDIGIVGSGNRAQVRLTVNILEQMRRYLLRAD
jgi:nicotinamide-nucleotide amidase